MKRFVLDCSVAMSWCFEDEADSYATVMLDMLPESEAVVPSIWTLEVANVLLVAERRGRLTEAEGLQFLSLLCALPITVEYPTPILHLEPILLLGRRHNLSAYDAAYLELAMRNGLPLATLDERLREVAGRLGVALVAP